MLIAKENTSQFPHCLNCNIDLLENEVKPRLN